MSEINTVDGSTETPKIDWEARALKAEAKIIDDKKSTNPSQTETVTTNSETQVDTNTPNYMTREDFEKEKFFEANTELSEHKDKINEYVSKGYSLQDAKTVLLSQDETIQARKITQNTNFTSWTPDFSQNVYSQDELMKLPQHEFNKVMEMKAQGKVIIK